MATTDDATRGTPSPKASTAMATASTAINAITATTPLKGATTPQNIAASTATPGQADAAGKAPATPTTAATTHLGTACPSRDPTPRQAAPIGAPKTSGADRQTKEQGKSWSSLFATQPSSNGRTKLHYEPPTMEGDRLLISATPEELAEGEAHWQNTLVGYFIGSRPPYHIVKARAEAIWKPTGGMEILTLPAGFFIFRFSLAEDRNRILEGGPWFIQNRLLLLKPWDHSTRLQKIDLSAIPVWVKIHDLPMALWTPTLISRLASGIGVPLYMDQATATRSRITYARICVEVSAEHQLPGQIKFSVNGDQDYILALEYDRRPPRCSMCSVFGHGDANCKLHPPAQPKEQAWRPKQTCTTSTHSLDGQQQSGKVANPQVNAPAEAEPASNREATVPNTGIQQSTPTRHTKEQPSPDRGADGEADTTTNPVPEQSPPKRQKGKQQLMQGNPTITVTNRFQFLTSELGIGEQDPKDQAGPSTVAGHKPPDPPN